MANMDFPYASIFDDHYPFMVVSPPALNEQAAWKMFAIDLRDMLPWITGEKFWRNGPSVIKHRSFDGGTYYTVEARGYATTRPQGAPTADRIDLDAILRHAGIE